MKLQNKRNGKGWLGNHCFHLTFHYSIIFFNILNILCLAINDACNKCYSPAYCLYFHIFRMYFCTIFHRKYINVWASPVVLAPLLSSGLGLGRVGSIAAVWELVEHPILPCAHRGLDGKLQSCGMRRGADDVVHRYRLFKWREFKTVDSESPRREQIETGWESNSFSPVRNYASCFLLQKRVELFVL